MRFRWVSRVFSQLADVVEKKSLTHISTEIVLLHHHSAQMSVLALGLSNPTPPASFHNQDFQRLETLHSCLKATQAFFEAFLSFPVCLARRLSFLTFTQTMYGLVLVHKLSTFESQDWDLDYARQTLNLGKILDRLIDWFDKVKAADRLEQGIPEEDDVFSRAVRKLGRIRAWHEQKVGSLSLESEVSSTTLDIDLAMNGVSADIFDETWLEELLGPWEHQYHVGQS